MHSPQPFPSGSAPVAVQSRPVSNRTYSAEIPRLDRCRHSSSAATSRIIAYQKRSHARISVPYQNPFCKPFCVIFRTFFGFFSLCHILCRPAAAPTKYRPRRGHTIILYRAGWRLLSPAGGVFAVIDCSRQRRGKSYKGLNSHACPAGADFCACKSQQNTVKGDRFPLDKPLSGRPAALDTNLFLGYCQKINPYCTQMGFKGVCDTFLSPPHWSAEGRTTTPVPSSKEGN